MKLLILLVLIVNYSLSAQNKNIDQQEILFNQAWVWEYSNDNIEKSEFGNQGEVVIYFNSELNYWLFTQEAYGISGEMIEWILAKPDGTYWLKAIDEFGKNVYLKQKLDFNKNSKIPTYYLKTKKEKYFNQNLLGFKEILGKKYKLNYKKSNYVTDYYLAKYNADFAPIYFFNQLDLETKLPVNFPLHLPSSILVLQAETIENENSIKMKLKMISHTNYYISLEQAMF